MAERLGVSKRTLDNWEQGLHEPEVRFIPAVMGFLGYDPEFARRLGLDPSTVQSWEADEIRKPYPRLVRLFEDYVEGV